MRDAQRLQTTLWLVELRHAGARMTDEENDPDAAFVYRQLAAQTPECDVNGLLDAFQRRAGLIRAWHQFLEAYPPLTPGRGKSRVKELEASVNAWSRSRRIREYLAAVAVGAEPDDEALQAWLPTGSYIC